MVYLDNSLKQNVKPLVELNLDIAIIKSTRWSSFFASNSHYGNDAKI
jgi:hypothetical protein